ncbi:MAG: hypothetical protein MK160_15515 [Rhodobacteraceae bacterium]|nr:hypothetical protein [Paracoccaceae bacterium]
MSVQVYWFYFNHDVLIEAGISVSSAPDLNVIYSTAGRLVAMIGATVFVMVTQNPQHYLVVLIMSILREGQEMFIDPLFPYANSPASPVMDFGIHAVIVAIEFMAFVTVWKAAKGKSDSGQ